MNLEQKVARLLAESLAMQLASLPEPALPACGLSDTLCAGLRAARAAFLARVTDAEVEVLQRATFADVRDGLNELRWQAALHPDRRVRPTDRRRGHE